MTTSLEARVAAWMERHEMARPGDRVAVAVSGGADSVALLLLLAGLKESWGLQLAVAHVDHAWRPESAREAEFVGGLARRMDAPFFLHTAQPEALGRDNREQTARRLRYRFFQTLLERGEATRVATAHTLDDQAETVLLRLLRGSGVPGLAGVWPRRACTETAEGAPGALIRPLLNSGREELRQWLRARGESWCEDPSNADLARRRNRIRHETLPRLRAEFNPELAARLATMAEVVRAEELYWQELLGPLVERIWLPGPAGAWHARREELHPLPLALQRRLVREGIRLAQGDLRQVDFDAVDRLVDGLAAPPRAPRRFDFARVRARLDRAGLELRPRAALSAGPDRL